MRSRMALLVSGGFGVLALILMFNYVRGRETQLLQLTELKDVLVAAKDIGASMIIDEQMVVRRQVPQVYLQPKALANPKEVVGRVAAVPIPQGAQILGPSLAEAGQTALSYDIPRGQRAVTISITEVTGVAGLVRPQDVVDILGTFRFGRPTGVSPTGQTQYADQKVETRLLAQNVKVAAVGREHRGDRPEFRSGQEQDQKATQEEARARRDRVPASVTLLLEPRLAQELVLADKLGTLTLALRSALDTGSIVDLGLLDQFGLLKVPIPVIPRPEPIGPFFREFRGGS